MQERQRRKDFVLNALDAKKKNARDWLMKKQSARG